MKRTIKSTLHVLASTFLLLCLVGCGSKKVDFADLIAEGSEVRIYEVFGMDCPGCHGGLENLIDKVPGVRTSKANWNTEKLKVVLKLDAEVDDEAIYDAIKRANFTPGKRIK